MFRQVLIFCFFLLFAWGCKEKNNKVVPTTAKKTKMMIDVQHQKIKPLQNISRKKIKNWKTYHDFTTFLKRFEKISPSESLTNASELKELSKNLKDSINVKSLNHAAFRARVNTLNNEILRLADMALIPSIEATEVHSQINKIFLIFNSVNAKIDAIFLKKEFIEEKTKGSLPRTNLKTEKTALEKSPKNLRKPT